MRTTKPMGILPIPALHGTIPLTVTVEYDPREFDANGPTDPAAAPRQATVALRVVARVGAHTLDLGVRADDIPAQRLPAGLARWSRNKPLASLVAEYRARLADLTIRLARHGTAGRDGVALTLSIEELEFLRHCLTLTERWWREAIDTADTAAGQPHPDTPPPPGFMDIQPTPAGYRAVANRFRAELDSVQRFTTRLGLLLDAARDAAADNPDPQ